VSATDTACTRPVSHAVTIEQNISRWQCQVVKAMGANAGATVVMVNGAATVSITWADDRWDASNPESPTSIALGTQL